MHSSAERLIDNEPCGSEAAVLKAAQDLNANSVCVVLAAGDRYEVALCVPQAGRERALDSLSKAGANGGLERIIPSLLRAALGPVSGSLLACTHDVASSAVIFGFGFASVRPPYSMIPPAVAEALGPVAYALWAARQLQTLRTELKVVNQKLAGRKLIERAKAVIEARLAVDEQTAYELLRKTSRRRRIVMTALADQVLKRDAAGLKPFAD